MKRWRSLSVFVLAITAVYLYALPAAIIFYAGAALLHTGVGVLLVLGSAILLFRGFKEERLLGRFGWFLLAIGGALGIALIYLGTPHRMKIWLYSHIVISAVAVLLLAASWMAGDGRFGANLLERSVRFAALLLAMTGIAAGAWWMRNVAWNNAYRINNPSTPRATWMKKGIGPQAKFFPVSVRTKTGGK